MTRKDYVLIAAAIKQELDEWADTAQADVGTVQLAIATRLAKALVADNPRFDVIRFLAACGF